MLKSWHKTIKYYSLNFHKNLFWDMGSSEYSLAEYQLEDYKEFFSELYSQVLNYYDDLICHTNKIAFSDAKLAYLCSINFILNFLIPFSKSEKRALLL